MNIIKTALAALCLSATSASAIPVGWSFNAATTTGTTGGSFVYDADTSMFSNFNITTTPAGGSPVAVNNLYGFVSPLFPILWSTPTPTVGGIFVAIDVLSPLTNAGGTASVGIYGERCTLLADNVAGCGRSNNITTDVTTMTSFVPPAAVPLPAAGALMLSALGLVGWRFGRRAQVRSTAMA